MRDEQGFTLIEVIAAMVAASLLLALLSWMIATLGRTYAQARVADPVQAVEALRPMLTGMLEGALPDIDTALRFEGTAGSLSAVVAPPRALGPIGPVRLSLEVRREADGETLFATFDPLDRGRSLPLIATEPTPLVRSMRRIDFAYKRRDPRERLATPALITITMTDAKGPLPPIVVSPRINTTGTCRFDPISMGCLP